ncbi:MAG: ATP-dependent DNA helicase [Candidatus Nanoarchaeia archaeon]|nr:ATP-dependent DNA helicase [Candidatus Nanoarchaeia archaeon]MDD5239695.1 ATP-dependent DNA helicase [Candidatus Nanoarchaeia archaeon]
MELFPFDNMRPVQKQMISDITQAINDGKHIIAHAPTGLGKTAAALSPALAYAIENGKNILFLTPKHTQHHNVVETLRKIKEKYKINVNVVDFIGKVWMCLVPGVQSLTSGDFAEFCREMKKEERCVFYNKVRKTTNLTKDAEKLVKALTAESPLNVEDVCSVCGKCEMCPYEIACELGKGAKVIIADYYHIFHPSVRKSFLNKTNKELDDCIIIVDEAQNLPERIREVLSSTVSTFSVDRAVAEARKFEYLEIANQLTEIHNILIDLSEQRFDEKKETTITREDFQKRVVDATGIDFETLAGEFLVAGEKIRTENKKSFVGSIGNFMQFWVEEGDGYVRILREKYWKDKRIIQLNFRCLDPAKASKEVFDSCHSAILMSGTLTPTRMYRDLLGMEEKRTVCHEYENPFPKANKLSIIVPDTTTKYTRRNEAEFEKIAKWCGDVVNAVPGNVAVFFPSYWLRDQVLKKFERLSSKSIFLERQGLSKKERLDMLNEFKSFSNTGAVFLGAAAGSFSEGIDLPGKFLNAVVVVGVPLESPDLETQSLIEYYEKLFGAGWDYGYIFPAMNKVVQACGRTIRSESDRGVIVLIDERFTWKNYFKCLPLDWKVVVTKEPVKRIVDFFKNA